MPRRIEVEDLPPVAVPGRILNEMCAHAREGYPEECCGLIAGDAGERFRRLFRCRNDMTQRHQQDPATHPRDGRAAFWMNESDQLQAQQAAEEAGLAVTAVYHSHVGAGLYLSDMDLAYAEHELFPYRDADQIVIEVHDQRVHGVGIFRRPAPGEPFRGRPVESGGP